MLGTRSGEQISAQIGKMGSIVNLTTEDFSLSNGMSFNIKNENLAPVTLEVQLAGMADNETVTTQFSSGWNPEIVKRIVKNASLSNLNLKWGY